MVISRQPFPNVPQKKQVLQEGELVVQLLTGATIRVLGCSPIKGVLITENATTKGGQAPVDRVMIDHNVQAFDNSNNQFKAQFPLLFLEGTRKNAATMKFYVDVQINQMGQETTGTLETVCASSPFVVMTNQKQWEACERTLLLRDAFEGKSEISWFKFANALQRQFIRATKQDPQRPARCLSSFDFSYLHEKFIGMVNFLFYFVHNLITFLFKVKDKLFKAKILVVFGIGMVKIFKLFVINDT